MKIQVFYGPKTSFKKIIPQPHTTLSELVSVSDARRRKYIHVLQKDGEVDPNEAVLVDKEPVDALVAYSESYSGITESAVQSFVSLLNDFEIKELYLQNPPMQIMHQVEQSFPKQIKTKPHKYKTLSEKTLKRINQEFSKRIIGQEAVKMKLLLSLYPLISKRSNKPIVIMFYGPSGVGKTETAKFLAELIQENLFRKQFSMFHNNEFGDYLFGGNHSQSSLARDLLERESNILLFDEFDKPNPVFHSAFYQLFDEGVFEDKNYHVELYNSLIVCTSNYQSEEEIRAHLGDPIFYRINSFIKFRKLSHESIRLIIENNVNNYYEILSDTERQTVDKQIVFDFLVKHISNINNVRQINSFVNELFHMQLLNDILDDSLFSLE